MKATSPRYPTFVIYEGYDLPLALESVGKGWAPLVEEVFSFIEKNRIHSKVIQVKEKWGGLRIYTDVMHDALDRKIEEVSKKSFSICEQCGDPGALREGSWYRTLCDKHADGRPVVKNVD
jgi:hypothetical protein